MSSRNYCLDYIITRNSLSDMFGPSEPNLDTIRIYEEIKIKVDEYSGTFSQHISIDGLSLTTTIKVSDEDRLEEIINLFSQAVNQEDVDFYEIHPNLTFELKNMKKMLDYCALMMYYYETT